jgi:dihydrodipicolinate synthase/N-acetylneuraminate lyase
MSHKRPSGGVVAPIVSPFNADESLDIGAFRAVVEHLVASGLDGLLVAGTTGEAYKLDYDERRQVYEAAVRQSAGRAFILAGTGATCSREAERLTALAAYCGCDAAVVLTPWFQLPTPDGIERYYTDLAKVARLPLLFYHNPPRTHLDWPVEHIAKLAHKLGDKFIGIKDSAHDPKRVAALRAIAPKGFVIYSGAPHQRAAFVAAGVDGTIEATINALPSDALACWRGDAAKTAFYASVFAAMTGGPNVIALLKQVMAALGLPAGRARRPHDQVDPARFEQIKKLLAAAGRPAAGMADGAE